MPIVVTEPALLRLWCTTYTVALGATVDRDRLAMVFPYGLHNTPPEFREPKGDQRKGILILCKEALLHEPYPGFSRIVAHLDRAVDMAPSLGFHFPREVAVVIPDIVFKSRFHNSSSATPSRW